MSNFDEATIIALEQDYPLVNVRPIADRISHSPDVHHPEGALKAAVKKEQEKAEKAAKHGREVAERQAKMERAGTEFGEVYTRFLDWFNGHLLACNEAHLTSPEMVEYFDIQIYQYEFKRGKPMHPYFARIMEYHKARWRGGMTREDILAKGLVP